MVISGCSTYYPQIGSLVALLPAQSCCSQCFQASCPSCQEVAQRDHVEFHLVKSQGLQGHDQYQWQVVDENADGTGQLSVSYEGKGDGVQAYDQAGVLVSAIDLCRGAYCTVIKFSWSSKIYRWVMSSKDAGKSQSQLHMSLYKVCSKQALACFDGPGFQQKQSWVQQPQHDVLSVRQTDDRAWLQVVVATCMVAAKTQRHKDKITDRSRRSGHGFV